MTPLLAALSVVGISAAGPLMAATAAPAFAIAFWRNTAATVLIAPFALTRTRTELGGLVHSHRMATAVAGAALAGHFATWVSSLKLTSVAAATALVSTTVVWVVLYDLFRGERLSRAVGVGVLLAVAGVLVVTGVDFTLSLRALAGDALALAGSGFMALYLVAGESVRARWSTTTYTFACYGTCALLLGVLCVVTGTELAGFSTRTWLLIAAVTLSAQFLGHSLVNHLLAVMSPTVISLVLLLEVPGAALLAGVFLGQSPAWGVYAGLVMILAGLAVVTSRRPPPAPVQAD